MENAESTDKWTEHDHGNASGGTRTRRPIGYSACGAGGHGVSWPMPSAVVRFWRRVRAVLRLGRAVRSQLPVLPVAGAQLRDVDRQVADAVGAISSSFAKMAERAQSVVGEASRVVGGTGAESEGVEGLLRHARSVLEELLTHMVGDGEVCTLLLARMDALQQDMAEVTRAIEEVERIALANTILALNARIEAAHLGDLGQGFELVAQELWHQAEGSNAITQSIRDVVKRLSRDAGAAGRSIRTLACADPANLAAVRQSVAGTLAAIETQHGDMKNSLHGVAAQSEELAGEIQNAVVSLQFQDRVSQRIGHLVDALESMHGAISGAMEGAEDSPDASAVNGGADRLSSAYTMQGERAVHAAALGAASIVEDGGDVELF
jgi:methyl-accepting chemotaxis protein